MRPIGQELMVSVVLAVEPKCAPLHIQAKRGNDERPGVPGGVCGYVLRPAVAVVCFQDGPLAPVNRRRGTAIGAVARGRIDDRHRRVIASAFRPDGNLPR
jgi:hypothetical protein